MVKQKLYFIAFMHNCTRDLPENTRIFLIHYLKNTKSSKFCIVMKTEGVKGGFLTCRVIL
jgi:hypothetical protein